MYSIEYHPELEQDLKALGHSTTLLVFKKLMKIAENPMVGVELGNKAKMKGYVYDEETFVGEVSLENAY